MLFNVTKVAYLFKIRQPFHEKAPKKHKMPYMMTIMLLFYRCKMSI